MEDQIQREDQLIRGFNQIHENFIVDNSPYPFPNGAYPYSSLLLSSSTSLTITFDESTKNAGIRLLFITATLLVGYAVVIGVLVYRTKKIEKEMLQRKPDYKFKRRPSELSRENQDVKDEDEESDIDNYEQVTPKELISSREGRMSR